MRSHGVPAFPDPVNGRIQIHVVNGQGLDPNSPQFQAAQQKCLKLVPGFHLGGTAGQTAGQQSALLKFAACMQTHGEPNFPDPKFSGGGVEFELPGINPNSPQYGSAYKACQSDLPTGMQFGASSGS
jgi:hypothetical protein